MKIKSRKQALEILGLPQNAAEKDIREAYRGLLKEYHPDNRPESAAVNKYYEITEAYEYLNNFGESGNVIKAGDYSYKGTFKQGPRVFGDSTAMKDNLRRKEAKKARERFEKEYGNGRDKRLQELIKEEKKLQEEREQEDKKKASVDRAMKSIQAILASRIIEEYLNGDFKSDK